MQDDSRPVNILRRTSPTRLRNRLTRFCKAVGCSSHRPQFLVVQRLSPRALRPRAAARRRRPRLRSFATSDTASGAVDSSNCLRAVSHRSRQVACGVKRKTTQLHWRRSYFSLLDSSRHWALVLDFKLRQYLISQVRRITMLDSTLRVSS